MEEKEKFMQRALELALLGRGDVSPNPLVGCVIVKDGLVIGEGWHKRYGEAHAEVNAINAVEDKSLLNGADLYVTLEPCAHHGKTPPCAELIIKYPFRKVYIANVDPNPLVAGKGIQIIKKAGIDVETGVLEEKGEVINRRFFTFIKNKRPYIILKWAETYDGFIAREDYTSKWISNPLSRRLVHKWRSEEDAIMVGRNTAACDNPNLNVRDWSGRNPVRVVLDSELKLHSSLNLFNQKQRTLIYNTVKSEAQNQNIFIKLEKGEGLLKELVDDLYAQKVQSVFVEGGSKMLNTFIEENWWDEIRRFRSSNTFQTGIAAPRFIGRPSGVESVLNDTLEIFFNDK